MQLVATPDRLPKNRKKMVFGARARATSRALISYSFGVYVCFKL